MVFPSRKRHTKLKLTSGNVAISNKEMSELLYKSMSTKYYWRDWLVIVYNPVTGGDAHYVWECGGFYKPRYYNRNLLVSSVDNSKPIMDININNVWLKLYQQKVKYEKLIFKNACVVASKKCCFLFKP